MVAPEGFVMSTVVAAFVADDPQQFVEFAIEYPAKCQVFWKRDLGGILGRTAPVEDRPRQMNCDYPGEHRDPHMPRDPPSGRHFGGRKFNSVERLLGVDFQRLFDPRNFLVQPLLLDFRLHSCPFPLLNLQSMSQPAVVTFKVVNVFRLEKSIKACVEGR